MKWTRKTSSWKCADYISEGGEYHVRDMSMNDHARYVEHIKNGGKKTEWWALLKNEKIIGWAKTAKAAKELTNKNTADEYR